MPAAEPAGLAVIRKAYPDVLFHVTYDSALHDWKIEIPGGDTASTTDLFWSSGRMLPEKERTHESRYWPLLYRYADTVPDPAAFTAKEIEQIKKFSSAENRQNGASTPLFFFDIVYDASSRSAVEQQLLQITFLGKKISVHKKIMEPLRRVQRKIYALAATDSTVSAFIDSLERLDGYYWRDIRGRTTRSFHSYGLAIDLLPENWNKKILYWNWQQQNDPENWMLTPLSKRWAPPPSVIQAFESEGFIWGGKWGIWDNMHFEYRPELIEYRRLSSAAQK